MNIKDIMSFCIENLPKHTGLFTNALNLNYTAEAVNHRRIRVDCDEEHGLIVGQKIYARGVKVGNKFLDAIVDNGWLIIETREEHDYTKAGFVEIEANGWAGILEINNVVDRFTLEFRLPEDTTASDFEEGIILEERDYGGNGVVEVYTVSGDGKSFVYTINEQDPDIPVEGEKAIIEEIVLGVRVAGAPDPTRAMTIFTETFQAREPWAFIMMNDEEVARDPYSMTDAHSTFTDLDSNRQRIMTNFDILVIFPTTDLGAIQEIQQACGEVRSSLIKSVAGLTAQDPEVLQTYKTVYVGSNMYTYNTATYVRNYSFQSVFDINYTNTARNFDSRSVALRKAMLSLPNGSTIDIIEA